MKKENQNKFYKALGSMVTQARNKEGMTVAGLAKATGEQYKTIASIEKGKPCSMHHLSWMTEVLNLDLTGLVIGQELTFRPTEETEDAITNINDLI